MCTLERLKINHQRINIKLEKEHNEKTIKGGENNKEHKLMKQKQAPYREDQKIQSCVFLKLPKLINAW